MSDEFDLINPANILQMYAMVLRGREISPRGMLCRNVRNLSIVLDSNTPVLTNFAARKFNLQYAKQEWLWYLRADRFDQSIEKHATMWAKIRQPDGSYFSNYGQYLFNGPYGSPVMGIVRQLIEDPFSRRASIPLLRAEHMFDSNTDVVCTYAINFAIEDDLLHMTVMMRSNDVVFGFTNDSFCFWQLHRLVHALLRLNLPNIGLGSYTHFTNSMHVYERHFGMLEEICNDGLDGYVQVLVPAIEPVEAVEILRTGAPATGEYSDWLRT